GGAMGLPSYDDIAAGRRKRKSLRGGPATAARTGVFGDVTHVLRGAAGIGNRGTRTVAAMVLTCEGAEGGHSWIRKIVLCRSSSLEAHCLFCWQRPRPRRRSLRASPHTPHLRSLRRPRRPSPHPHHRPRPTRSPGSSGPSS